VHINIIKSTFYVVDNATYIHRTGAYVNVFVRRKSRFGVRATTVPGMHVCNARKMKETTVATYPEKGLDVYVGT
jgi:hypothetical protein